jgi:uncharacterized protein YuzE
MDVAIEGPSVQRSRGEASHDRPYLPYVFDRVRYDHDADVLYLSQRDPARAVDFDETPGGHAVSFDANGDLVGLTLIDIRRLLDERRR